MLKKINSILLVCITTSIIIYFFMNFKLFIVDSGSMNPTLKINDMVMVKSQDKYEKDDIITFYDSDFKGYVTHRIIETTENNCFVTKGDFNNVCDENIVNRDCIVGKVIFKSKVLGLLLYKYKIVTIVVIISVLILSNVYWYIFGKEGRYK